MQTCRRITIVRYMCQSTSVEYGRSLRHAFNTRQWNNLHRENAFLLNKESL